VHTDDVTRLTDALAGVRRTAREGLAEWRYHGRLVARQIDDIHIVIRADFDYRDSLVRQFPGTFSVPARFIKHMMVVADLASGDAGAIEDALVSAWQLQLECRQAAPLNAGLPAREPVPPQRTVMPRIAHVACLALSIGPRGQIW